MTPIDPSNVSDLRFKLLEHLHVRRHFIEIIGSAYGSIIGAGLLVMVGDYGSLWWWGFLILAAIAAGWLFATLMWPFCAAALKRAYENHPLNKRVTNRPA